MRALRFTVLFPFLSLGILLPGAAFADTSPPPGAAQPDEKALVAAPKPVADAPKVDAPGTDSTSVALSAGGQLATGNSRLLAVTANGKLDLRRGANGFGASIIGNYGESGVLNADGTPSTHTPFVTSTENFQGRLRYDRYILDRLSVFLIGTVRHDKFQGIDGRVNVDPGVKYLFVLTDATTFWGEVGYDFQYDARNGSALGVVDASGNPVLAPNGDPVLLSSTATDHSVRAFLGFKHAFNSKVTFVTGLEYLQSLYSSDSNAVVPGAQYDYRINYDALLAANVGGGFSFGVGFSARYDNTPLPGKQNTDTVTTFNLIYAFSDGAPPPPTCPCPPPPPPPPPAADTAPPPPAAPPAPPAPAAPATSPAAATPPPIP
jgi:Protein of unknown function, DUF481